MAGCHARPCSPGRERAAVVAVVLATGCALLFGALLLAVSAAVRLAAEVATAAWRRLGISGRLVTGMILAWAIPETAQSNWRIPLASAAVMGACWLALVLIGRYGRWRWRKSGGRAWNEHQAAEGAASPLAVRNSERLDAIEDRLNYFLGAVAEAAAANGTSLTGLTSASATTVPQLTLLQGGGEDQEAS